MSAARAAACALALAAGACGCGASPQYGTMPIGVVVAPQDRGKPLVDGVYASSGGRGDPCCWMGPRAHVRVQKDEAATDIAVEIYVPDVEPYRRRSQSLTVSIEGGPPLRRCCIVPGNHTLLFRLAPELRARTGTIDLALEPSESFVPARTRRAGYARGYVAADTRTLSVQLIGVTFKSF